MLKHWFLISDTEKPSLDSEENSDAAHADKSSKNGSEDSQESETKLDQSDDNSENTSLNKTVEHDKTMVIVEEVDNLLEEQDVVVVSSPTDNAQGPIVALSLGLAITLLLLIFVGCRLRNVKRRLRKGRALHSNEADYLINGMYL